MSEKITEKKAMMLKQNTYWGCGLYAVANALDMPEFITDERLEVSKEKGNNIAQLTKWLNKDGCDWFIVAEYITGRSVEMPMLYWSDEDDDGYYVPLIVQLPADNECCHMIAIRCYEDRLLIFDSAADKVVEGNSMADFRKLYPKIVAIYAFADYGDFNRLKIKI